MNPIDQKEKIDISIAVIVVLAAGILMYFIMGASSEDFFGQQNSLHHVENTLNPINIAASSYYYVPDSNFSPLVNPVSTNEQALTNSNAGYHPSKQYIFIEKKGKTDTVMATNIQEAKIRYFNLADSTIMLDTISNSVEENDFMVDSLPLGSETTDIPKELESSSGNQASMQECIILIGSFSKSKNAIKLKKALEEASYSIFFIEENNLTKVGIYIDCNDPNFKQTLQKIRQKYASDAHIFRSK